jgi:hypothetical protein
MRLSDLITDKELEENGVWVPFDSGMRVKVCRLRNAKAQEFLRRNKLAMRDTSTEEGKALFCTMIATAVLVDWDGLVDDDGAAIPYTPAKAVEVFKLSPDFLNEVIELASQRELFHQTDAKESAKN